MPSPRRVSATASGVRSRPGGSGRVRGPRRRGRAGGRPAAGGLPDARSVPRRVG